MHSQLPPLSPPCTNNKGNSAWTPVENTYNHFLTIDLGYKSTVRKIASMGRPFTNEFVTEYIVQYSDDGEYWRSYVNPSSEPQVIFFNKNLIFNIDCELSPRILCIYTLCNCP